MRFVLALLLACFILSPSASQAAGARGPFMPIGGRTSQPIGHYEFCKTHLAECTVQTANPKKVKLTEGLWNELIAINNMVNAAIMPKTDMELYGVEEFWTYPTTAGDCEDYVLLKRRDLIEKGWPVSELLITVVRQKNGDGHAVLVVRTDRGDLALDNLDGRIMVWNDTDYDYLKQQSENDSGRWVDILDPAVPVVAKK